MATLIFHCDDVLQGKSVPFPPFLLNGGYTHRDEGFPGIHKQNLAGASLPYRSSLDDVYHSTDKQSRMH
jgi:hypothetical protein